MAITNIEWATQALNIVTGCTRVSEGCNGCYAVAQSKRNAAMGQGKYAGLVNEGKAHFNGVVKLHIEELKKPFMTKQPTSFFVCSMSDIAHPNVPFWFIATALGVFAANPQHVFLLLTKRIERLGEFYAWLEDRAAAHSVTPAELCQGFASRAGVLPATLAVSDPAWPLTNVWVGTSVEDERVSFRLDHLRAVPAAVRFISAEPLIGPLDLHGRLDGIHWTIVGGESGPRARLMQPEWAEDIQKACGEAGVAFFFKQAGSALGKHWGMSKRKGNDLESLPDSYRSLGARALPIGAPRPHAAGRTRPTRSRRANA